MIEEIYEVRFSIDDFKSKIYGQIRSTNQQSPIKNQQSYFVLRTSYLVPRTSYLPHSRFKVFLKIPTSLSPRPETFTITISDFFIFGARLATSAMACADSSAGMMPSVRASRMQPSSASSSDAGTYSARPPSLSQACSGPIDG